MENNPNQKIDDLENKVFSTVLNGRWLIKKALWIIIFSVILWSSLLLGIILSFLTAGMAAGYSEYPDSYVAVGFFLTIYQVPLFIAYGLILSRILYKRQLTRRIKKILASLILLNVIIFIAIELLLIL